MMPLGPGDSAGRARRLEITGLAYLLVIALLVWVSIASYRHVFSDHVTVTVDARQAGQQLNVGGDVRMNGAIVGRVSAVDTRGSGARISLQINSGDAERIPKDVVAAILPTTLFGQKYVELHSSSTTAAGHIGDGSVIAEDRSAQTTELTNVIDDLGTVLAAAQPDRVAASLGGISEGLDGRGHDLAALIDGTGNYLGQLNAQTPLFEKDLALLDKVAGQYADNAPALLSLLGNATVTARSLTRQPTTVSSFISALTGASISGTDLLRANADLIAESAQLARPTSELLAQYSPELVCVIQGFLAVRDSSAAQIRNNSFQGYFTVGRQARGYTSKDALKLGDLGTGPACRGLPHAPIPYPAVKLNDGAGNTDLFSLLDPVSVP